MLVNPNMYYWCVTSGIAPAWVYSSYALRQSQIMAWTFILLSLVIGIFIGIKIIKFTQDARSNENAPTRLPPLIISNNGKRVNMEDTGHTYAQPGKCCICYTDHKVMIRCKNIADDVCLGCVIQWTITSPNSTNPWPCCRPPSISSQ